MGEGAPTEKALDLSLKINKCVPEAANILKEKHGKIPNTHVLQEPKTFTGK